MVHKLRVYRRDLYKDPDLARDAPGYSVFMGALERYDLLGNFDRRTTKWDYSHAPGHPVQLADYTAEIFVFKYTYKERIEFFRKLSLLKDDSCIARLFWIGEI